MDEATANVDYETDAIIQETVMTQFQDCTLMTIAHRIDTIINYDRIIVMDKGSVAENGTPAELIATPGSIFSGLVELSKAHHHNE